MKIWRFVPNARDYAALMHTRTCRWWPEGIDLGGLMEAEYPKTHGGGTWAHEGNRYRRIPAGHPLSDFPALTMQVPILSPRAAELLHNLGLISTPIPLWVSGEEHYAVQPLMLSVMPDLPRAFVPEQSKAVRLPGSDAALLFVERAFDESRVPGEFFTIPELEPYSDLYVTERFVARAREAGLAGLEYLELVYDERPVPLRYAPVSRAEIPEIDSRRKLEWELLAGRCLLYVFDEPTCEDAIIQAVCNGQVTFDWRHPIAIRG
jgi:hypothetical protein